MDYQGKSSPLWQFTQAFWNLLPAATVRLGLRLVCARPLEATGVADSPRGVVQAWSCGAVGKGPLGGRQTSCKRPTLCIYSLISLSPSRRGRASCPSNQGPSLVMEVFARSSKRVASPTELNPGTIGAKHVVPKLHSKATSSHQQNPTVSYKFKWSPEGTGPGRREVGSQRAGGGADSLHPDSYRHSTYV